MTVLRPPTIRFNHPPIGTLILLAAVVSLLHLGIDVFLSSSFDAWPDLLRALAESVLLVATLSPVLHLLVYRPLCKRITEHERMGRALRSSEEHYRRLVDTADEGIWALDAHGIVTLVNSRLAEMFGYATDEMIGRSVFDLVSLEERPHLEARLERRRRGLRERYDFRFVRRDGAVVWVIASTTPILDPEGRYMGSLAIFTDITGRKQMEEERERLLALVQHQNAELQTQSEELQTQNEELHAQSEEIRQQEESLGRAYIEVEARVRERTAELARANEELKHEIGQREKAELALRAGEAQYRRFVETANEGIWVADAENRTVYANRQLAVMLGYAVDEMLGQPVFEFADVELAATQRSAMERRHQGLAGSYDLRLRRKDGTPVWFLVSGTPIYDESGRYAGALAMLTDITQRKRLEAELARRYDEAKYLADHDPVTGLLNHRAIHARLEEEVSRARRYNRRLSVVVMDLDQFKLFNDTYGHPVGDEVIRDVAALLRQNARDSDLLGRYGGDEFTVILPDTNADGAVAFAERARSALQQHPYHAPDGLSVPIRMSFGIATYPVDASQPHALIACADANLYEAKQHGGDTIASNDGDSSTNEIKLGSFGVLDGLVTAVDHKDHYTRKHSEQMTDYAVAIAQSLGLSEESQRTLRIAGLLHDVGKIGVPDRILRKPGRLDDEELAIIKQHVTLGEVMIKDVPNLADVTAAIGAHHERIDGQGYPRGTRGCEIPLLGRIMAVADAYSAMTTDRPYQKARSAEEAYAELRRVAGTQLDPELVDVFLRVLDEKSHLRDEGTAAVA